MIEVIFDLEATGLELTSQVHCIVCKDIADGYIEKYTPDELEEAMRFGSLLVRGDLLIGHNIRGYDLPLLYEQYGWSPTCPIRDTYVWSMVLQPSRPMPFGAPGVGRHSLGTWGYRVGRGKPEYDDWATYDEAMLHRCEEDVEINHLVYDVLLKEAGL